MTCGHTLRLVSIRPQRNKRCVTIPQMPHKRHAHENISGQRARTSRAISYVWRNTSLFPKKYARCPRHIARATCDTCDKQTDNGNTSPKTSIHHCTRAPQQDVSELVLQKEKRLNEMCCKQKPTRMVVRNRVTLDNEHRSTKNKCSTTHKKRNRRARTQMWFTSRHIKCWCFPHRKDRILYSHP